jgi:uncharacterized protein
MRHAFVLVCALLVNGCVSHVPDHFYVLTPQPTAVPQSASPPAARVGLRVTLPSLVDRNEMVVSASPDGIRVLEHERWGAPLADQVTRTLAQDIERRRSDVWIAGGSAQGAKASIIVNVVQLSVRQGQSVSMETNWRIVNGGSTDLLGSAVFSATLDGEDYAAIARGISSCVALLTDRLAAALPGS